MMKEEGQQQKKRKSLFKIAEELHERLEKQKQDKLNSLTALNASSWLARQLIQNAIFGKTGGFTRNE